MSGKMIELNLSREAIEMNDLAFPDSSINTVGVRLDFPETDANTVKEAFERVIEKTAILHLKLVEKNGVRYLEDTGHAISEIVLERTITIEEAEAEWEKVTTTPLPEASWNVKIYSLKSGGCSAFFLMHHLLVDGFTGMQLSQLVLNELNGVETDTNVIDYGRLPENVNASPFAKEENKNFWMHYFEGIQSEASIMPGDPSSCDRIRFNYEVSKDLLEKINSFEEETGLKDSAVFGAALSIWISRSSQTEDGVFLMPRLNRDTPEDLSVLDCRTLVVPVRNRIKDEDTFIDICRQSARQARDASAHKHYGIKNIANDLHASGILNGMISEYVLNCVHCGKLKSDIPFSIKENMSGGMSNHLTIAVQRVGKTGINMMYDSRIGVYDEESTTDFNNALLYIIEQGISGSTTVGNIEIIAKEEKDKLLNIKGESVEVSATDSIADLFRKAVERFSDRPALYAGEKAFTYEELDKISNRIANALIERGVKQGEPVLYKLKRDYRLIPALLGIIKSGAAFIPLDPAYPEKRISYITKDSGASKMIVSNETSDNSAEIACLNIDELISFSNDSDPMLDIPQNQLAYSIYTSGTTGNPKGVLLTHKGIVNITSPENNPFNKEVVKNGKGIVAIGSVCFDISLFEFFVPLFNGSFIELAPEEALADPKALAELILRHGANLIHCTPSRLTAYLREDTFSKALLNVDAVLSAGEVLPRSLIFELREDFNVHIYNGYGPTETTIGATITEEGDEASIGKPIGNMGIMILDSKGRLLPFGALGEICIFGNGVGLGYHDLETETEKRFVEYFGRRVYRTGDVGRFFKDGRIEYHGRNDFQVKLRGLRIELAEIENCMMSYQGVNAACAQVRNMFGRDTLIGFYTKVSGTEIDEENFRSFLGDRLTHYMVPDILKCIDEMPSTPGGKLDLKKLSQIPVEYVSTYRAPENEYQEIICDTFSKVLNIERVSINDSFFEIGGDSLHTAEIIHALKERIPGLKLAFGDIFKYPVPETLAQFIYRQFAEIEEKDDSGISKLNYKGIDALLSKNILPAKDTNKKRKHGNILLTGATGFLGLHILMELLKTPNDFENIYCLIRPTKRLTPEKRLKNLLFYFENTECEEMLGTRIFALEGDIANKKILDTDENLHFDTVINCAADVAHYAFDNKLTKVNTEGVRNLIELCERNSARFIQISTISVSGFYKADENELAFKEKNLYVGQIIDNQYILSKYMAEYECLKAMAEGRVDVKIMRVGNLQGRLSDGEFQVNKNTNAFTRRLSSYVKIGMVPKSVYESMVNFSPVDEVAHMICSLAALPSDYTVFHVSPDKEIPMKQLFDSLTSLGRNTSIVSDDEFNAKVEELKKDPTGRVLLEGLLADIPDAAYRFTVTRQNFTDGIIKNSGLVWGEITEVYLTKYLQVLDEFGLFEGGIA